MPYQNILFDITDNVALITINRPDDANALTRELAGELFDAAVRCSNDAKIRAVVLTGSGKMFCAGGDLKDFDAHADDIGAHVTHTATLLHNAEIRFNTMDAPLVIAINGTAAGGGFSLSLCGDYAIAADHAKFVSAYTASGLSPDGSSSYFLAKHVGLMRAKELILTNRVLSANEAVEWGLINQSVPGEDLMNSAMELALKFACGPTRAYGASKRLLLSAYNESLASQLDKEAVSIAKTLGTRDAQRGLKSFLNKQTPQFTGE